MVLPGRIAIIQISQGCSLDRFNLEYSSFSYSSDEVESQEFKAMNNISCIFKTPGVDKLVGGRSALGGPVGSQSVFCPRSGCEDAEPFLKDGMSLCFLCTCLK